MRSPAQVSLQSYRDDPLYPRIVRAVDGLLRHSNVVAPVDVLVAMGMLEPARLADWRFGRVPYLERVIQRNLGRLSRLLRILRFHAHDLNLVSSVTAYVRHGKGSRPRPRFTKTGDPRIEEAYSRHFVWPGKRAFHPPERPEPGSSLHDERLRRCPTRPSPRPSMASGRGSIPVTSSSSQQVDGETYDSP